MQTNHAAVELVKKATEGDKRAFVQLCEQHANQILYMCAKVMGNYHDGEDAAQEVLLIMQRDIVKLQNPEAFKTWMYRLVVRNCGKMKRRLHSYESLPIEMYTDSLGEENEDFLPEEYVENEGTKQMLLQAIDELPEKCRVCLVLFYYEDMKYHEIAEVMGLDTNDVGNLLAKAKKLLRRKLEATLVQQPSMAGDRRMLGGVLAAPFLAQALSAEAAAVASPGATKALLAKAGITSAGGRGLRTHFAKVGTVAAVAVVGATIALAQGAPAGSAEPVTSLAAPLRPETHTPIEEAMLYEMGEINTLDDMIGAQNADRLREYGTQSTNNTEELLAFFQEIGLAESWDGMNLEGDEQYALVSLQKGGKLLMVIVHSQPGAGCDIAYRFTQDTEALPQHIENYLFFGQWKAEQGQY